jgi:hypothetical protein
MHIFILNEIKLEIKKLINSMKSSLLSTSLNRREQVIYFSYSRKIDTIGV